MATLRGRRPDQTFGELLKMHGAPGVGLADVLLTVGDGNGELSPLKLSKTKVQIDGELVLSGVAFPNMSGAVPGKTIFVDQSGSLVWGDSSLFEESVHIAYQYTNGKPSVITYTYSDRTRTDTIEYNGLGNVTKITTVDRNMTKTEVTEYDSNTNMVSNQTITVTRS